MISKGISNIRKFFSKHWKQLLLIVVGIIGVIIVFYLIVFITGWL